MANLSEEYGMETLVFLTAPAFLSRIKKSPTGSVTIQITRKIFLTPGMLPSSASSRKQMRQRLKSRIKPRGRPHLKQRRTVREENFGLRFAFTIIDFFAMYSEWPRKESSGRLHPALQLGLRRCALRSLVRSRVPVRDPESLNKLWVRQRPPTRLGQYMRSGLQSQT